MSPSLPLMAACFQHKKPFRRRLLLTHYLRELAIPYSEQEFSLDYQANILIDIPAQPERLPETFPGRGLISTYYDKADAEACLAVLLGLVEEYASAVKIPAPLRFLFLDAYDHKPSGLEAYLQGYGKKLSFRNHPFHLQLEEVNEKSICYLKNGGAECQLLAGRKVSRLSSRSGKEETYLERAADVLHGMIEAYSHFLARPIQQSGAKAQ